MTRSLLSHMVASLCALFFVLALTACHRQAPRPVDGDTMTKNVRVAPVENAEEVSFDGTVLVFEDDKTDGVNLRDMQTGKVRRVVQGSPGGMAGSARLTRDNSSVAYMWRPEDGNIELRMSAIPGSPIVLIEGDKTVSKILPRRWSQDSQWLLITIWHDDGSGELSLVSLESKLKRVLQKFPRRPGWVSADFSQDGRFVAWDYPSSSHGTARDIYAVPTTGDGPAVALVDSSADDRLLGFAPDGRNLLFMSDRSGQWAVWVTAVKDGKSSPPTRRLYGPIEQFENGQGFTRNGDYYYSRRQWENVVTEFQIDAAARTLRPVATIVDRVSYDSGAHYSPDGKRLSFSTGLGTQLDPFRIHLREFDSETEKVLTPPVTRFGSHTLQPRWSPSGKKLLIQARDLDSKQGLFQIDTSSGAVQPIVRFGDCPPTCAEWPAWAGEDAVVFVRWERGPQVLIHRDLQTGKERELYRVRDELILSHSVVSPNGRVLAFIEWDRSDNTPLLRIVNLTGRGVRTLGPVSAGRHGYTQPAVGLAWLDDSRLIHTQLQDTGLFLRIVPLDGGEPVTLLPGLPKVVPYGLSVGVDRKNVMVTAGSKTLNEVWVLRNLGLAPSP